MFLTRFYNDMPIYICNKIQFYNVNWVYLQLLGGMFPIFPIHVHFPHEMIRFVAMVFSLVLEYENSLETCIFLRWNIKYFSWRKKNPNSISEEYASYTSLWEKRWRNLEYNSCKKMKLTTNYLDKNISWEKPLQEKNPSFQSNLIVFLANK